MFYRRLDQVRIDLVPEWSAITPPWSSQAKISPKNTELVNIGQVKELFFGLQGAGAAEALVGGIEFAYIALTRFCLVRRH